MAEFAWRDISIFLLGKAVTGARNVSYEATQDTEHVQGIGAEPLGVAVGQKTYEGSLTLLQSEVEALQASLPRGSSLLDIQPFDISVSFANASGSIVTDRLRGCVFKNVPKEMGNEDMFMEVELEIIITRIEYNI